MLELMLDSLHFLTFIHDLYNGGKKQEKLNNIAPVMSY